MHRHGEVYNSPDPSEPPSYTATVYAGSDKHTQAVSRLQQSGTPFTTIPTEAGNCITLVVWLPPDTQVM